MLKDIGFNEGLIEKVDSDRNVNSLPNILGYRRRCKGLKDAIKLVCCFFNINLAMVKTFERSQKFRVS